MAGAILRILLILLPFILYFLWLRYTKKRAQAAEAAAHDDSASKEVIAEAQTQLVQALGLLLAIMAAGFIYMALSSGEDPTKEYIPPHMENGKLVPGTFRSQDATP